MCQGYQQCVVSVFPTKKTQNCFLKTQLCAIDNREVQMRPNRQTLKRFFHEKTMQTQKKIHHHRKRHKKSPFLPALKKFTQKTKYYGSSTKVLHSPYFIHHNIS